MFTTLLVTCCSSLLIIHTSFNDSITIFASDDLRNRDVAAYNGSYKEAQRHTEGNGKAGGFST
jgi:hypothetical protein